MELRSRRGFIFGIAAVISLSAKALSAQTTFPNDPMSSLLEPQPLVPRSLSVQPDPQQTQWASQALTEMQTVSVGMTRAQMANVFERAGGLYLLPITAPLSGVYSYRKCPYFKVNVDFQPVRKAQKDKFGSVWTPEDPKDVITKISKPFLEQVYSD